MAAKSKLTAELAEAMCEYARQGLPVGRAAALVGIHRVTAQHWMSIGAAEIAEAGDDDDDLGPRAAFAISFDAARAEYLLGLSAAWQAAVARKDPNTPKVIATMLASVSPDEYSERRATRTQHTTLTGDVTVGRFATMSTDDLNAARAKIVARRDAAQAGAADDCWQSAAVRMPRQGTDEDRHGPAAGKNNSTVGNPGSESQTRKTQSGGLGGDDPGVSQKNISSRARSSNASVEDGPSDVQTDGPAPEHGEGGATFAGAPPSPPDDEDLSL